METKAKPGRYFPKGGRGVTVNKAAKPTIRPTSVASKGEDVPSSPQTESQTQLANRLFRERVAKIADAEVIIRPGDNEWEPNYFVMVPEFRSEASRQISELRGDLYRKYPKSILNVHVRGRRELSESPINDPFLID